MRPLLFLDMDDVLCLNDPYGGYDVLLASSGDAPKDLWQKLFHPQAKAVLLQVLQEHQPAVVLTTSWIRFLERPGFEAIFGKTGLEMLSVSLHDAWEAPQLHGQTRCQAIEGWLSEHRTSEPFVVVDDTVSGTGLKDSELYKAGRVILCDVGVGLQDSHLFAIGAALRMG